MFAVTDTMSCLEILGEKLLLKSRDDVDGTFTPTSMTLIDLQISANLGYSGPYAGRSGHALGWKIA